MPFVVLLVLAFVNVAFPLFMAWRIHRLDELSRKAWLANTADGLIFSAVFLLLGRWDILGYYTRPVIVAVLLLAVVASWRRHRQRPWSVQTTGRLWRTHWPTLVSATGFGLVLVYVVTGMAPAGTPMTLAFPLEGGRFVIAQGGNRMLLNYHHPSRSQRFAADIVAVNEAGFRAPGLQPADAARYVIHGLGVISPCAGKVTQVRDGLPDLAPPDRDKTHPAGNHVVIDCDGAHVELAHLQRGSIGVQVGERLATGQRIARVGNSGNTNEPHLHIHAVDAETGAGIEMAFDGTVPVRNRVFQR
jgi:hypothetical protein